MSTAAALAPPPIAPTPLRWRKRSGALTLVAGAGAAISSSTASLQCAFRLPTTFAKVAPKRIACCRFSHTDDTFAIVLENDHRVAVWSFKACRADNKPELLCTLLHTRPVVHLAWRKKPDVQSQSGVLVTRTDDGVARLWAPVIDDPHALRMVSVIDPASMIDEKGDDFKNDDEAPHGAALRQKASIDGASYGQRGSTSPALYLDAADVSSVLKLALDRLRRELREDEPMTTSEGSTHKTQDAELKKSRARRLEHLLTETPDLFLCFDKAGTLVIKAVANIDRRPPTLCETFTVLKLYAEKASSASAKDSTGDSNVRWDQVKAVTLVPEQSAQSPTSCYDATGLLMLSVGGVDGLGDDPAPGQVSPPGREQLVMLQISPALLFDGLASGLRAIDTNMQTVSRQHGIKDGDHELLARYSGDWLGMMTELQDGLRRSSSSHSGAPQVDDLGTLQRAAAQGLTAIHGAPSRPSHRHTSQANSTHEATGLTATCAPYSLEAKNGLDLGSVLPATWAVKICDPRQSFFCPIEEAWIELAAVLSAATKPVMAWSCGDSGDVNVRSLTLPFLAIAIDAMIYVVAPRRLPQWQADRHRWILLAHADISDALSGPKGTSGPMMVERIVWLYGAQLAVLFSDKRAAPLLLHDRLFIPQRGGAAEGAGRTAVAALDSLIMLRAGPLHDLDVESLIYSMMWGQVGSVLKTLKYHCNRNTGDASEDERRQADLFKGVAAMVFLASPAQRKEQILAVALDVEQARQTLLQRKSLDSDATFAGHGQHPSLDLGQTAELAFDLQRLAGQLDDLATYFLVAHTYHNGSDARIRHRHRLEQESITDATTSPASPRPVQLSDCQANKRFLFAYHSESQEALSMHLETLDGGAAQATWAIARRLGIFLWVRNQASVLRWAENVARAQFTAGEEHDPSSCALFYYALGKEKLMINLWRQAVWHPEQKKMLNFLQNDFKQPRWRSAALKNAFTLLSRRRFLMAASFFLLGDSLEDAVNVCMRNLYDFSLAVAICRVWQHSSPVGSPGDLRRATSQRVLTRLLQDHALPQAFAVDDRWMAAWAFDMLQQPNRALLSISQRLDPRAVGFQVPMDAEPSVEASSVNGTIGDQRDAEAALMFKWLVHRQAGGIASLEEASLRDIEARLVAHATRRLRYDGAHSLAVGIAAGWTFEADAGTVAARQATPIIAAAQLGTAKEVGHEGKEEGFVASATEEVNVAPSSAKHEDKGQAFDLAFDLDKWDM